MIKYFKNVKKIIMLSLFLSLALTTFSCQTIEYKDGMPVEKETLDGRLDLLIAALEAPRPQIGKICKEIIEEHSLKAVYKLEEHLANRNVVVRTLCIYCLGRIYLNTKSSRVRALVPKIKGLLTDKNKRVQLEAAGTLCLFKVYDGIPLLISALRHKSAYVRMNAIQTLFLTFKQKFGYEHNDEEKKRERAADKWESWWLNNKDNLLK